MPQFIICMAVKQISCYGMPVYHITTLDITDTWYRYFIAAYCHCFYSLLSAGCHWWQQYWEVVVQTCRHHDTMCTFWYSWRKNIYLRIACLKISYVDVTYKFFIMVLTWLLNCRYPNWNSLVISLLKAQIVHRPVTREVDELGKCVVLMNWMYEWRNVNIWTLTIMLPICTLLTITVILWMCGTMFLESSAKTFDVFSLFI